MFLNVRPVSCTDVLLLPMLARLCCCCTVDRQMRRYSVPRVVFVNKLDRVGANPFRVIQQAREKLKLNAAAVQVCGVLARFIFGRTFC